MNRLKNICQKWGEGLDNRRAYWSPKVGGGLEPRGLIGVYAYVAKWYILVILRCEI